MKMASGDFSEMAELTKDIAEGGKEGKREKKVNILQECKYPTDTECPS